MVSAATEEGASFPSSVLTMPVLQQCASFAMCRNEPQSQEAVPVRVLGSDAAEPFAAILAHEERLWCEAMPFRRGTP